MDSDALEIVRESVFYGYPCCYTFLRLFRFKLKFQASTSIVNRQLLTAAQSIVAQEQEANFISRLHGGKLKIIPWPVIESRRFYTLFSSLKRALDEQPITHPNAGAFLHTLKTLMAKLKVHGSLKLTVILLRILMLD